MHPPFHYPQLSLAQTIHEISTRQFTYRLVAAQLKLLDNIANFLESVDIMMFPGSGFCDHQESEE